MTNFKKTLSTLLICLLVILLVACQSPPEENPASTVLSTIPPAPTLETIAGAGEVIPAASTKLAVTQEPPPSPTARGSDYPGPELENPTQTPAPYPYPGATDPPPSSGNPSSSETSQNVYLPMTGKSATATLEPTATTQPAASPTPIPTVDFSAAAAELQANGQDLGFSKLGFHVTLLEDRTVLDNWTRRLDEAGVPLFIKTVDNAEPLFRAQELMKTSGVPHVLVYRSTGSVPHYELPPVQAAQLHWEEHKGQFPPELDPSIVWIETLNEPDRTQVEWLGSFAEETARLAMADGFRWAAFGWASGEPEPEQWQSPSMLAFLQLAGANPEKIAVAVHEYSYIADDISHEYPYKVGRFLELFRIADEQGFPRPTVLITEWGWEYADIPSVNEAMRDLNWAAKLYAPYPQVKGAAIWNLGVGCCYGDISDQVQRIIDPLTTYSLTHYFAIPQAPNPQPVDPNQFQP